MLKRREFLQLGAGGAAAAFLPRHAGAQPGYPDRAIKLIVPRPAGGVVDIIAREWSGKVSKSLGTTYIENMGGGGGIIGAAAAARAPADGYTLLLGTTSELVISPLLGPQPYDPVTSFEPIAIMCDLPAAIVVHPSLPVSNLKELVAYARQNKDRMNYGSAGAGTVSNLAGELFKHVADLPDIVHIPYKGGGPAVADAHRRPGPDLDADDVGAALGAAPAGQAQDAGGGRRAAAVGDARLPTGGGAGLSGSGGAAVLRAVRAGEDAEADHRQGRAGDAACDAGPGAARRTSRPAASRRWPPSTLPRRPSYVAKEIVRWKPILAQFKPQYWLRFSPSPSRPAASRTSPAPCASFRRSACWSAGTCRATTTAGRRR